MENNPKTEADKTPETINAFAALKSKKARYGTFSLLTAIVATVIMVVINLLAQSADISFDFTQNKMFTISNTSKRVVEKLDTDVYIYALFRTGSEIKAYQEILEQYARLSNKIHLEYKDPYLYPLFTQPYAQNGEEIAAQSIIVEAGKRFKVIAPTELIEYEFDYTTYENVPTAINLEPKVTNAIEYVLMTDTAKIYGVTGHGETALSAALVQLLDDKNFSYGEVNLLTSQIPEDCAALMLTTPARDYTAEETAAILSYLQRNGKAVIVLGAVSFDHPNLDNLLAAYGVRTDYMSINEGDSRYQTIYGPSYFLPSSSAHEITEYVNTKVFPFVFAPQAIGLLSAKGASTTITPLLTSSASSYGRLDPTAQSYNKEEGDVNGPFTIAAAITDSYYENTTQYSTRLVLITAASLLNPTFDVSGGNLEFIANSFAWAAERTVSTTYVAPKSIAAAERMTISLGSVAVINIFAIGILPLGIFGAGFAVWIRRRVK